MPQPFDTFHVVADQADQTLAALLRAWLPGSSWAQARRIVGQRRVEVNGNLCLNDARRLKAEEVVRVYRHARPAPPKSEDVVLRYLDSQIVVVEKPAFVTSVRHPEEAHWSKERQQRQPTLDEMLPKRIAEHEGRGHGRTFPRLRPVHRLDRETSGLMVFARTPEAERHLGQQFRRHTIQRRYLAVARGIVEARTIESCLAPDRGDGRRGSTTLPNVGKRAVTHVRPLEMLAGYTLLECRLETGRTHQIRIHLAEAGHALCGEKIYHRPLFGKELPDESGAPRTALHAAELGLVHPLTQELLNFTAPLPKDLAAFLERLRRGNTSAPRADA